MISKRVLNPCLIILLSLVSLVSFAQSLENSLQLTWNNPKKILDSLGNERWVLNFEKAQYLGQNAYLPAYRISIQGQVSEFKLSNVVYEALTSDEAKIIPSVINENVLEPKIVLKYSNKTYLTTVYIIPLKATQGAITDKIISFTYSCQTTNNLTPSTKEQKNNNARISASSNSSVLSSGDWYKISISKSGIFKIDYNFLSNIGINPSSIDPREIKIYGNGGGMLPQNNSEFRNDDLVENSIFIQGESDGTFNTTDYILFYGQGPDTWTYNSSEGIFVHSKNLYSSDAFYFINVGPGTGLRITDQASIGGSNPPITTFDERLFYENDNVNLLHSGREWYGESFDNNTDQNFSFSVPGLVIGSTAKLTSAVMGQSTSSSSFTLKLNNQFVGSQSFSALSTYIYSIRGIDRRNIFSIPITSVTNNLNVALTYNKGSNSSAIGYLNYLEFNIKRDLKLYNNQTAFRSVESLSNAISEFTIKNASASLLIWDITNPLQPKNQLYSLAGSDASFSVETNTLKEFIAFSGSNFDSPNPTGKIATQNLHGLESPNLPDLVILTHPSFLSSANRLAQFRNTHDNMDVEVVTPEQIYNEFSSGAQDVTAIRDFMQMLYDRKTTVDSTKYLLILGDCSYDYKNRIAGNTNFVPIYESRQSMHPTETYSSDDYFGFLDYGSGTWEESSIGDDKLNIGIGRLPAKNISEAEAMINKIIHYSTSQETFGKWRNRITFFADDGDNNLHLNDANYLSNIIKNNYNEFNVNKIFLDAYPQISSPGGETCPPAKDAITQAVEKGTLILNYTGHGGETGLAQERLVDLTQVSNWNNFNALAFFITATCEFGRYDDPGVVSGAEYSLLHSNGGAIGLISSTRPVYSNSNRDLNQAIYESIFKPISGQMPCLGDVIRLTKNNSLYGVNNRNYALLADPSMTLAYPKEEVVLTKINNNVVSANDTLKALGTVTLEGEIRNKAGVKLTDFNGSVQITVMDKYSTISTLGTQGSSSTTFQVMNNLIYEGSASATNGSFQISFVVPKDISYQFDKGKISLYAKKENSSLDANGYNADVIIGGSNASAPEDKTPPEIKLYMNDQSFVFGGLTGKNSLFLAKIADENGINIAGQGIGHEITAKLDDRNDVLILNEYYTAKKDNYKEGSVEFPFKDLSPGNHSLKFKCWDTHNNSAESYLEFIVANDEKIALDHVLNYPNPFSTHTTFHFDHNRAGDDIDILVQVYTISGKLIKTLDSRFLSSPSHISDIIWDGRDDFGDKIGKGVYVYKVNVRSLRDASHVFKYQKLVILN
jgi:hypothetical protein